ncbi:ATP synthase F1 subunit epsilon [bacterium]|nr:ATP synthase F1 subunit epsilon [bacterium]
MNKFSATIISPEKTLFEGEIEELLLPTENGQIGILPNHAPLVSKIAHGEAVIKNGSSKDALVLFGGFVHVLNDRSVIVLADSAYHIEEINEKEAQAAKERAEQLLVTKEVRDDKTRFAEIQSELLKSITALKALRKYRKK